MWLPAGEKAAIIILLSLSSNSLLPPASPEYPSQNLRLKMALTPICCSNGANNGARESKHPGIGIFHQIGKRYRSTHLWSSSNIDGDHRITKWVKSDLYECYSAICSNVITRSRWMLLGDLYSWKYALTPAFGFCDLQRPFTHRSEGNVVQSGILLSGKGAGAPGRDMVDFICDFPSFFEHQLAPVSVVN